jgi:flagellar hook-length control protein FliK
VPSAASETVAFASRPAPIVRSKPASQGRYGADTPFSQMLEASAPPISDAPRAVEPSEPSAPPQKAATASDPKKGVTDRTSDGRTDGGAARPDQACCETETAESLPATTDIPTEEIPSPPSAADAHSEETTKPAGDDGEVAVLPIDVTLPQTLPPEQPVAAAPSPIVTETPSATPLDAGDAAPELAAKPAGTPAPPSPPASDMADADSKPDTPEALPAPGVPAAKRPQHAAPAPAKPDVKAVEGSKLAAPDVADGAGEASEAGDEAHILRMNHGQSGQEPTRQARGHDDARPQASAAATAAEQAQHKPALPATAAPAAESAQTPPSIPTVAVPDAASVAINNPRTPLMAASAVPLSGIAVEIAAQARAGNNRFEIRLDPPELGRIDVRLDVDREGNVKSRLVIERSDTYDLLRRDASTLERALQQAGLKTSDNGLEFTLRDQGASQREARDQNQRNAERAIVADADIAPANAAQGYGRLLGLGAGLDIRI